MTLFISTYINKVDKKGRVSIPANFRSAIGDQSFKGIIVYYSFINNCIEACDMERIKLISESIDNLDPYSEERDALATAILGGSMQLSFDSEGRVMLPQDLMKLSEINDQAAFVGKGATFEIWEPDKFSAYSCKARELARQERSKLHFNLRNKS